MYIIPKRKAVRCHFCLAPDGMLWDQLEEYGGEDGGGAFEQFNTGCLARIKTASAKQYVRERYLKWKGLSEPLLVERDQADAQPKPE